MMNFNESSNYLAGGGGVEPPKLNFGDSVVRRNPAYKIVLSLQRQAYIIRGFPSTNAFLFEAMKHGLASTDLYQGFYSLTYYLVRCSNWFYDQPTIQRLCGAIRYFV